MEVVNALGRRKTAVARVYVKGGSGKIEVNKKDYKSYFPDQVLQYVVEQPIVLTESKEKFDIKVNLNGGGLRGQAEALRLAISRALVAIDEEHKSVLRKNGLLTRDAREVERKKPGQKKARKRFQFSKR